MAVRKNNPDRPVISLKLPLNRSNSKHFWKTFERKHLALFGGGGNNHQNGNTVPPSATVTKHQRRRSERASRTVGRRRRSRKKNATVALFTSSFLFCGRCVFSSKRENVGNGASELAPAAAHAVCDAVQRRERETRPDAQAAAAHLRLVLHVRQPVQHGRRRHQTLGEPGDSQPSSFPSVLKSRATGRRAAEVARLPPLLPEHFFSPVKHFSVAFPSGTHSISIEWLLHLSLPLKQGYPNFCRGVPIIGVPKHSSHWAISYELTCHSIFRHNNCTWCFRESHSCRVETIVSENGKSRIVSTTDLSKLPSFVLLFGSIASFAYLNPIELTPVQCPSTDCSDNSILQMQREQVKQETQL